MIGTEGDLWPERRMERAEWRVVRAGRNVHTESRREHRFGRHLEFLEFSLLEALGLGPPVLEPDLDLSFGEVERGGELGTFGYREVLLLAEFALKSEKLWRGEGSPGLPVRLVLPERALHFGSCEWRPDFWWTCRLRRKKNTESMVNCIAKRKYQFNNF